MWRVALSLGSVFVPMADVAPHLPPVEIIGQDELGLAGFRIHRDELLATGPRSFVVIGRLVGDDESEVVLSAQEGALVGTLRTSAEQYRLRGGLARRVQPAADVPERMPLVPQVGPAAPSALNDTGDVLDLLVVYTPRARLSAGGGRSMEALVQLGVAETNLALRESGVPTRVRLVEMQEVSYEEAGRVESDLEILAHTGDGALDEVHALRDSRGADFVQLVVEESDGCGIAYLMREDNPGFSAWAFSVVEWSCIDSTYALAHELGHNLGCDHAPEDPSTFGGPFEYSFGYRDPSSRYRTIMAYGPGRRFARFSSPRVTLGGRRLGTARQDNARTIARLRTTLANFRPRVASPEIFPGADVPISNGKAMFRFQSGYPVAEWWLLAGSGPGKRDFFDSGSLGTRAEAKVSGLPVDGSPVYVRLFYRRGRVWLYEDHRYTTEHSP
ncbi:MAG TPA: M12 family metallo-peptidase [Vicinamibacteria bacterium]|nr:M12 family metallo-peptidase [Vicinamibacteria bacterium]